MIKETNDGRQSELINKKKHRRKETKFKDESQWKLNNCIYTTYIHVHYLYQLQKQVEKRIIDELFCPVQQRVQIIFIFTENLRILCLSCNFKKTKSNCKIVLKQLKQVSLLQLSMESYVTSALILLPFITVALQDLGTRKALLGP